MGGDVSEHTNRWSNSHNPSNVGEDAPNGLHLAKFVGAKIIESKDGMQVMVIFNLKVVSQEHAGCEVTKFHGKISTFEDGKWVDNPAKLDWLAKDLIALGVNPDGWSKLPEVLDGLIDRVAQIQVSTGKGGFKNIYFDGIVEDDQVPIGTDDDIPF